MNIKKKQDLWFLAGLLGIAVILFWRCFYSVNTNDEAYYIGTVYRLFEGDGMLCDEWNPTQQMCSFWLYPFYVLFRMLLGSNEGMILAFRLLYIAFQLLISGYLYARLRRFGKISMVPVFFYLLSTAFNINSLSYNTMANSCILALLVTLGTQETVNLRDGVLEGIFASIVVMGNPYAVAAYALYAAACVAVTVIGRKKDRDIPVCLQFGTLLRMSLTAAAVLLVFLGFTFWHATLDRILKNLPYIVGDQEHHQRWWVKISSYFGYFHKYYPYCALGTLLVSLVALLDKKRREHGGAYLLLASLFVLPHVVYQGFISDYVAVNLVTIPICFLGLPAFLVMEKRPARIFYVWYLPAMAYPFIVQITSNTGPLAVSASFAAAGAASVLLCLLWVKEQAKGGKLLCLTKNLVCVIVALQLIAMLYLRITYVWGDDSLDKLTTKFERGPAKGLYTTAETVNYYNELYDDIDALQMKEDDGFLVVGSEPMLYLYAEREVASYSTWQVYTNETRLYRYYEIHEGEGKFPSVVYCVEPEEDLFDSILVDKLLLPMGYEWKELTHGIAFLAPSES